MYIYINEYIAVYSYCRAYGASIFWNGQSASLLFPDQKSCLPLDWRSDKKFRWISLCFFLGVSGARRRHCLVCGPLGLASRLDLGCVAQPPGRSTEHFHSYSVCSFLPSVRCKYILKRAKCNFIVSRSEIIITFWLEIGQQMQMD